MDSNHPFDPPVQDAITPSVTSRYWKAGALFGLLIIAIVFVLFIREREKPLEQLLAKGQVHLAKREYDLARQFAERALTQDSSSTAALLLSGRAYAGLGQIDKALSYFDQIPDDASADAVSARCIAGELLLKQQKKLIEAEQQFRRAISQAKSNLLANNRLAYLLGLESRDWESIPYRIEVIKQNDFSAPHLYALALGDRALDNPETMFNYYNQWPDSPATQLGMGRINIEINKISDAERLLRAAIHSSHNLMEAQYRLGQVLEKSGSTEKFIAWNAQLPPEAEEYPGIWYIRGVWERRQKHLPSAVRCFWEAVRRNPDHAPSNYQLGQVLVSMEAVKKAEPFLKRANDIEQFVKSAELAFNSLEQPEIQKTADYAEQFGFLWEAVGWANFGLKHYPNATWPHEIIGRLQPKLEGLPFVRSTPDVNPALKNDLSEYPLPDWKTKATQQGTPTATAELQQAVTFENQAAKSGLKFSYYNSGKPHSKGIVMMYEVIGGGAAILDFDRDGWPDIHLPQGAAWPVKNDQRQFVDHLFRNLGNGQFEDVTELSRIFDNQFSQGGTVGDFNNDGFDDLYITNIGGNRLFQNNGDGTFTDITDETGIAGNRFTASAIIADLNGDTWPDIYAVNYLSGDDLFTKICGDNSGVAASCLPHLFPASQDQMYLNLGNGRFKEVTSQSGIVVPHGKGLGIVAADFDRSGKLSLFIANDVAPNFFFSNQTSQPGAPPQFIEQALPMGLSLNGDAQQESSMGVAAGDADGDGLIDLFVTNFDNESNTLYRQEPGQIFLDVTQSANLTDNSVPLLGWGTQFVDGELDGRPDLIVTNGHVNDLRSKGRPYQMPPQYFRNVGEGRFEEVSASTLGPFFEGQYLGRGMARLDWNRDGLEDVVISHLDAPVALLTNTTKKRGHFLALRLVGVQSARDAIGTTVTVKSGSQTSVRQLTAGDGNQSSNQRLLVFGLGENPQVDRVEIHWPSGQKQDFEDLKADAEYIVVEGQSEPVRLQTN